MQLILSITGRDLEKFSSIVARLKLPKELAAKFLLIAAVEALEIEERFFWPLELEQVRGTISV
jgi:hypothetical protein